MEKKADVHPNCARIHKWLVEEMTALLKPMIHRWTSNTRLSIA